MIPPRSVVTEVYYYVFGVPMNFSVQVSNVAKCIVLLCLASINTKSRQTGLFASFWGDLLGLFGVLSLGVGVFAFGVTGVVLGVRAEFVGAEL